VPRRFTAWSPRQIVRPLVESAIAYGLPAPPCGRIDLKDGEVVQGRFDDHPVLRMSSMPKVEVHFVGSTG
jgi:isoquinoline 1-oxidoreductase beta subunit